MNTTKRTACLTDSKYTVTALNSIGDDLSTKVIGGASMARLTKRAKLQLASDALVAYGMSEALVDDVYGDDTGLYVDLAGTDDADGVIVSLRIALCD
jgi:hypothetical protein